MQPERPARTGNRARWYYEEAIAESDPDRRLGLFERSFNEHATYEAAIGLAEAGLELDLPSARSLKWLDKAFRLATPGEARARVLFRIGEIHLGEGDRYLARDYMERSLEHLRGAPDPSQNVEAGIRRVERALQEVWGDEPPVVPTADIIDALRRREPGDPRGAVSEIDLWINFEFDSARLTRTGRDQADELGEALLDLAADEGGRTLSFVLVGHTDTRGITRLQRPLVSPPGQGGARLLVR